MAKLEIELSEYDAMREARKAAEARVEELKQENKDLRNSSKVIIRRETKHLVMTVNENDLAHEILERLRRGIHVNSIGIVERVRESRVMEYPTPDELARVCISAWQNAPKKYSTINPTSDIDLPSKTDTLVGFEDIRMNVENMFKEQFQQEQKDAIELLHKERAEYEKKRSQISKELAREFRAEYESQFEALNKELEKQKAECKVKDEIISDLNKQIIELSKSQEVKVKEAEEKVRQAQEELAKIKGHKPWWRR